MPEHLISLIKQIRDGRLPSMPVWFLVPGGSVHGTVYSFDEEAAVIQKAIDELQARSATGEFAESPGDLANQLHNAARQVEDLQVEIEPPGLHLVNLYDVLILSGGFQQRVFTLTLDLRAVSAWRLQASDWQFKPGADGGPVNRFLKSL